MSLNDNPRYAAYSRAHGRTPEQQLEQDRINWPGGSMCGFVLWNNERIAEYARVRPDSFCVSGSSRPALIDHEGYNAWLETRVDDIVANGMPECAMCGRQLNRPGDLMSRDCGGDCWGCIGKVEADGGDPESSAKVASEIRSRLRNADGTAPTIYNPK